MKITNVPQKCANCHGTLVFDVNHKTLNCKKCGNVIPMLDNTHSTEKSFQELLSKAPIWQKDTAVYCCEQCGAKSVVTKNDLVVKCDYCGAKAVSKTQELPGVRPDTIIGFDVSPDDAKKKAHQWLSKKFFVPDDFLSLAEKREINGIYFPVYAFDTHTVTRYVAMAEHTRTSTSVVGNQEITHKQTFRRPINGIDENIFNNVLIVANDAIKYKELRFIEPFDFTQGQIFREEYLAGFGVAQAPKEPTQTWEEAKQVIGDAISQKIKGKYGNCALQDLHTDITFSNVMYKYALLPIYIGHTEYKGKRYNVMINGQTGKVHGKTPRSGWKIFSFFATMGAIAVGLGILVAMFL